MQQINIDDLDLKGLKALAYDLIVQREYVQRNLIAVEREIQMIIDQQNSQINE